MIEIKGTFRGKTDFFVVLDKASTEWQKMALDMERMLELHDKMNGWYKRYKRKLKEERNELRESYYSQHREERLAYAKKYRSEHKDELKKRRKEKIQRIRAQQMIRIVPKYNLKAALL